MVSVAGHVAEDEDAHDRVAATRGERRGENERQQLIEEMKAKNFEIGSLFLD